MGIISPKVQSPTAKAAGATNHLFRYAPSHSSRNIPAPRILFPACCRSHFPTGINSPSGNRAGSPTRCHKLATRHGYPATRHDGQPTRFCGCCVPPCSGWKRLSLCPGFTRLVRKPCGVLPGLSYLSAGGFGIPGEVSPPVREKAFMPRRRGGAGRRVGAGEGDKRKPGSSFR